jgi:hypothetical protein
MTAESVPVPWRRLFLPLVAALALAAVAAGVLLWIASSNYEVLEEGKLLPYTNGHIYKVRFFGRFTLFVEPEGRLTQDTVNAYVLVGIGFISLTFAVVIASLGKDPGGRALWFFAGTFFGANYLAADEFLGLHETMGHNLQSLRRLPLVERPDDLIVLVYLALAAAFLFVFRRTVTASRRAVALASLAFGLYVLAAAADLWHAAPEELIEVAGSVCLIGAVLIIGLEQVRRLRDPSSSDPEESSAGDLRPAAQR